MQCPLGVSCVLLVHAPAPEAKAKLPLIESPVSFRVVVPELVNVTVFAVLVLPVLTVPKFRLDGDSDTRGLITAVTVIGIVCGLPVALSVITKFAA